MLVPIGTIIRNRDRTVKLHRQLGSSRLRARVWLHQLELDRALAAGADWHASKELETRALQLQSEHFRRHLLATLDAVMTRAGQAPHWHTSSLPVQSPAFEDARDELEDLRQALFDGDEIPVCGLARAACLLDDPSGPLYRRPDGDVTLTELAHLAAIACAPGTPPTGEQ
jgi:hypothetical protein